MLDTETKRRIDTARDILVGKVPDPKSQVEQITIALIYKFMDDMDAEAEELGGKRRFFNGEFAKYGWAKLMSPAMGGHEVLNLYGEAITRMTENVGIPPLFRDIFKNAYLPYRDPETLKSFLKIIDDFEYDHSERLGDAFEYLLSVLGSQGDAGQFRTPRHIIDFMVQIIDPKKDESVLDPACGTAGFLISAYKHTLKNNSKDGRTGATLTPDERKTLTGNINGYDISPDMVRLSLVNLYLHGFTDPHIAEYDTLTSEDNWNEYADIILANPPFMSPKGGIKPHKRFSVQAKRSEVLFVDYIAEHLTPNGRAAVIVPEGIIFQSQNAYKQLREMLIKNYLYAVVSLPAGVFNPYSGVKTSILLMDKALAKRCDSLLFVKVENDGFNLGAQRRKIDKNDLPKTITALQDFHQSCLTGEEFNADLYSNVLKVEKEKIGENGEWNLSGERYRENDELRIGNYELYKLKNISTITKGSTITKATTVEGDVPVIAGGQQPAYYHNKSNREGKTITVSSSGVYSGFINFFEIPIYASDCTTIQTDENKVDISYLYRLLKSMQDDFYKLQSGGGQPHVYGKDFGEFKIPLPPLKIQQEIVAEIEGYQKIIDGARSVVDNYKPQIQIDPEWEMVKLGEVCELNPLKKQIASLNDDLDVSFVPMADLNEHQMSFDAKITKKIGEVFKGYTYFQDSDVLLAKVTPCFENGKAGIANELNNTIGFGSNEFYVLRSYDLILPEWIYLNVANDKFRDAGKLVMTGTGGLQRVPKDFVKNYKIPLPPLKIQQEIIAQIEKEQSLVNANKELITLFEQKIKDKIATVWGE